MRRPLMRATKAYSLGNPRYKASDSRLNGSLAIESLSGRQLT
jgi:hypothetical protein